MVAAISNVVYLCETFLRKELRPILLRYYVFYNYFSQLSDMKLSEPRLIKALGGEQYAPRFGYYLKLFIYHLRF